MMNRMMVTFSISRYSFTSQGFPRTTKAERFPDRSRKQNHLLSFTATLRAMQTSSILVSKAPTTTEGVLLEYRLFGMLAQLDQKPMEEMEMEDPSCDGTTEAYDIGEESNLPPPLPYFDRRTHATSSAPMIMQTAISRVSSSPSNEGKRGRDILQSRAMAMSMPNLHSRRSTYNRGIGYSVLSNAAECGDKQGKRDLRARIEEFESLLEDL